MSQWLEFHQLDRRLERLRVRHPARQRHLIASLAETSQQILIIVIQEAERYLVIDGHKRIAALQTLGRDTVEAVVWDLSEADALLLDRSLRMSEPDSALEQGWLLAEMEERLGYSIDDLARSFDRSGTWVARRLSLVETLPETVQQQVREGKIGAQIAMRYLVPVARVSLEQCLRMAAVFSNHCGANQHWTTRQAAALYNAWREAKGAVRQRILANPELLLKTQQQPAPTTLESELNKIVAITQRALHHAETPPPNIGQLLRKIHHATTLLNELAERIEEHKSNHVEPIATRDDSGTPRQGDQQTRDRTPAAALAPQRAQGTASELQHRSEDRTGRESGAVPATDPGVTGNVQRQPGASP